MKAKSVEGTAEAIGADIPKAKEDEIRKIVRLDLPIIVSEPVPILYVRMDGTGLPVVNKETEGAKPRPTASRSTHVRPSSVACSPNHMGQGRLRHWQLEFDHLLGSHRDRRRVRQVYRGA